MSAPRCLVASVWLILVGTLAAQTGIPPVPAATPTAAAASDEHAAKVAERYRAMLASNPVEGLAFDRLWKSYEERGQTGELVESYQKAAASPDADLATLLIDGYLLQKAGRTDEAVGLYERAAKRDPASPLPSVALAEAATLRGQPEEAASQYAEALLKVPAGDRRRTDWLLKQGAALLSAGKGTEAAQCWEQITVLNPADLAVRRQLAEVYEKNGFPDRAVEQYQFVEAHGDPAARATAWREIGRLQETRGNFDAARDALERGLTLTSRDNWLHGDLQTRLIRLYQRAGRVPELAARWRAAVEGAPRDLGGYLRLESLAEADGNTADEREWLEKIVALAPGDREDTLKLAALLANAGERQRAADLYDALLKRQGTNLDLLLARADLNVQLGQPAAAISRLEGRVAQSPADESITTPALNFFLEHHLAGATERLLRAEVARELTVPEPSLALAKFLFSERRATDARAVLDTLGAQPGDPVQKAARFAQIADAYKAADDPAMALAAWRQASVWQPESPAPLLAAADSLRASGDIAGAVANLEQAIALSPAGEERLGTERKLFETLRGNEEAARTFPDAASLVAVRPDSSRPEPGSMLGKYLAGLDEKARNGRRADDYLRLARWQSWAHDDQAALAAAEEAIALDPSNVPARELVVAVAVQFHRLDLAEQTLSQIAQLDPTQEGKVLRQLANLKLTAGDFQESLRLFGQLQQLAPGSRAAWEDLALAQQRADRWFDALASWKRAYALPGITPAQRGEIRRPLLAAYEHLGQFPKVAEVLLQAVDAETDLHVKEDLFRQLADVAHKHGMGTPLRNEFETRLRQHPDDYFTLTALAQLRQDDGTPREAYLLLQRAYYSSPDPARTLHALVQTGEELGETTDALTQQRRLLALPGQSTVENLEKLAALQTSNLDVSGAAHTWDGIVTRFPRDPAVLGRAADFFESNEQMVRAADLVRQAITLDPADLGRRLKLAKMEAATGDTQAALGMYAEVLAQTNAEEPGRPLSPPDELRLPAEYALTLGSGGSRFRIPGLPMPGTATPAATEETTPRGDGAARLEAIRETSLLLFPQAPAPATPDERARTAWLTRWQQAADAGVRNEPLQAFYYAGNAPATMELLEKSLAKEGADSPARGTFLAAGLRLGAYETLARWTWHAGDAGDGQSERENALLGALEQYLRSGGRPAPDLVGKLFPPLVKRRALLWETAKQFAELHWYAPAAELGQRALALVPSGRAVYAESLAEWELYAGSVPGARAALQQAVEEGGGSTFDVNVSPVLANLREYFLLLPEAEREPFAQDYLRRVQAKGEKNYAILAGVLLHGLAGDEAAARHNLDALLAARPLADDTGGAPAETRRWAYVLANGVQLQAWNLDSLAVYFWRQALAEVTAFDHQFGEAEGPLEEIKRRLLGAEVAVAADPEEAREVIAAYLAKSPAGNLAASVAGELLNDARFSTAVQINESLCRAEPNNPEQWRALFATYEAANDPDRLERCLAHLFESGTAWPDALPRSDFVCRWAAARERDGDPTGAVQVLEDEQTLHPGSPPILTQLAQTYERSGLWNRAEEAWCELLPVDPSVVPLVGLANAQEHQGQGDAAVKTLEEGLLRGNEAGRSEVTTRLVRLHLALGQMDAARELALATVRAGTLGPLGGIADAFAAAKQEPFARELLAAGIARTHDADLRVQLQETLVGLCPVVGNDAGEFLRQMNRLEIFVRETVLYRNGWESLKYKLARRAGADAWLEKELSHRWQSGKGDYLAGERLATLYLETHRDDPLAQTIGEFNRRPMLPEQLLFGLENALMQAGHGALALPIAERLSRRFPQNEQYALQRAVVLWKSDRRDEANGIFQNVAACSVLRDDLTERVALTYLALGDKPRARDLFEKVVRSDPAADRSPGSFLQLAGLDLEAGRHEEASNLLRTAYRQDACDDFRPLVNYLSTTGQLNGKAATDLPAPDFLLTFRRRALLLVAVHDRLEHDGRREEARQLLLRHPGFLAETPAAAVALCRNLSPEALPATLAALQTAVNQLHDPMPQLVRALDALRARQNAVPTVNKVTEAGGR